jgi:hypothetical protein
MAPGGFQTSGAAPGATAPAPWTAAGGLSLDLSLTKPDQSRELAFSKVGGDPQLTLAIRPREALTLGIGALWTLVWLVIAVWAAAALARAGAAGNLARALPWPLIAVGLIGFFLLPTPLSWVSFAAFVVGALAFAFQPRAARAG